MHLKGPEVKCAPQKARGKTSTSRGKVYLTCLWLGHPNDSTGGTLLAV